MNKKGSRNPRVFKVEEIEVFAPPMRRFRPSRHRFQRRGFGARPILAAGFVGARSWSPRSARS